MDRADVYVLDRVVSDAAPFDLAVIGDVVQPGGTVLRGGSIGVRDGVIAAIAAGPLPARCTVDARGKLLLPGAVDAHVHTRSNPDEGISATTLGAAAGGTTTVIDMPFDAPDRPVRDAETLRAKAEDVDREAYVDVALWATFGPEERDDLDLLDGLAEAGACGFKASVIGVDPVRFPRIPDGRLLDVLERIATLDRPFAAHQENEEIVASRSARVLRDAGGGEVPGLGHARSRPPVAETEATGRLLELARAAGARLHIVHGTVDRTFELVAWHRATGTRATAETCLHYLVLDEGALERHGGRAKCNPPLRAADEVEALWRRIDAGDVDLVTSDHSPYPASRKSGPILEAAAGLPGVESLLRVLFSEGVARGRIDLGTLLRLVAERPAEVFGLSRKGRLAPGMDADVVVFDPAHQEVLDEATLHHASGWSPFHGRPVTGRVESVLLRGTTVFDRSAAEGAAEGGGEGAAFPAGAAAGRFVRPG